MPRGLKAWKGQLIDPESGNRFRPGSPGFDALVRQFPDEAAAVLSGNSTPRSEAKERAKQFISNQPMKKSTNVFTNENVLNTESELLKLFLPEINARQANLRNNGVDVITDIGPVDIQYFTKPGLPFLDLISAGNFSSGRSRLSNDQINTVNRAIADDIYNGANLQDVMNRLDLNFNMYKPGKLLNTTEYPAVASVLRREGGNILSNPTVLDLVGISKAAKSTPLKDLGMNVRFNLKDNKPYARNDSYESAYVSIDDRIAREFDITSKYF